MRTAHSLPAAAARAAAIAPGAAAAAASSTPALPTSRRPRRLSARPARALAPASNTGAHRPPPGTRWGRPGARTPRPEHVSARRPARSPALRGRPPTPGCRSEPGRRVSTARRARCLLPFPGDPSPIRGCHTTPAHAGEPQPYEKAENGGTGTLHHPISQVPQLWEGATNGVQEGPSNFSLPALLPSGGGATADCRAEPTEGRGAFDISVLCFCVRVLTLGRQKLKPHARSTNKSTEANAFRP